MTYQLVSRKTRQQIASGLTLAQAARACQLDATLVFLMDGVRL